MSKDSNIQIQINHKPTNLPYSMTLAQWVEHQTLELPVALILNNQFIPKGEWTQHLLTDGDHIDLLSPIQGG